MQIRVKNQFNRLENNTEGAKTELVLDGIHNLQGMIEVLYMNMHNRMIEDEDLNELYYVLNDYAIRLYDRKVMDYQKEVK